MQSKLIYIYILDCEKWKISFWLNGKEVGKVDIDEGLTYYPAFCARINLRSEYKLFEM